MMRHWALAGKSAALIMRRMNARSIVEARQLQQEQLVEQLNTWSMRDTLPPAPDLADGMLSLPPHDRHEATPAVHEPLLHTFNVLLGQAGKHASLGASCSVKAVCRSGMCRGMTQAGLEQDCWRLLNRCIQHVEAASERDKAVDAAVQRVMDTLIQQVTFA